MRPVWLLLASLTACGPSRGSEPPRLPSTEGIDPFVLDRIEAALDAYARGESGALLELAKVYDANGVNELAEATYALCLEETSDPRERAALVGLRAQTLEALGRLDEALEAYEAALELGDDHAPTSWRRGQILLDQGRLADARAAFERARALEPESIPAALGLARVLLIEDDARAALEVLAPVAAAHPDERFVHGLLARAYGTLGEREAAAAALSREEGARRTTVSDARAAEVRTRATGVVVGLRRANEALVAGDARRALEILAPLHARCPDDLALLQLLGKALVAAGEHARAAALLEDATTRHPRQFKLELYLGLAREGLGDDAAAARHLEAAHALNPEYGPTLAALGTLRTRQGRRAEAEELLQRALDAGEDDLRLRLRLTQVQVELRALDRARATAEAACAAFPGAPGAWALLAETQARAGDADAARASLAEAERRNPDHERLPRVRALLESGAAAAR